MNQSANKRKQRTTQKQLHYEKRALDAILYTYIEYTTNKQRTDERYYIVLFYTTFCDKDNSYNPQCIHSLINEIIPTELYTFIPTDTRYNIIANNNKITYQLSYERRSNNTAPYLTLITLIRHCNIFTHSSAMA